MKNIRTFNLFGKQSFLKSLLLVAAMASISIVSCKKDINNEQPTQNKAAEANPGPTPKEQAESVGKTAYSYIKYYYTTKKPEDYLNPAIRTVEMAKLNKAQAEYKNLTAAQSIQKAETDGKMTQKMATSMTDLLYIIENSDDIRTIDELDVKLKNFEERVYGNKELRDDEKVYISGISTTIRSVMRFTDEMTPVDADRLGNKLQTRESCLFGRKLSCYGAALLKAGVAGASSIITIAVTGGTSAVPAAAAFLVGLFQGIVNVFADNSCKCGETAGCYQPQVINPVLDQNDICSPAVGFALFGSGSLPQAFSWSAFRTPQGSQYEYAIPDVQNKITTDPLLAPFYLANATDNIRLVVVTFCNGNQKTTTYRFKLTDMLGDPGSVYISGPYDCYLNGTGTFYMSGGCLINPFNSFSWNQPSVGTILSGGNTSAANIKFTMKTCGNGYYGGCFPAYIVGNCTNPCSQLQSGNAWSVVVH